MAKIQITLEDITNEGNGKGVKVHFDGIPPDIENLLGEDGQPKDPEAEVEEHVRAQATPAVMAAIVVMESIQNFFSATAPESAGAAGSGEGEAAPASCESPDGCCEACQ